MACALITEGMTEPLTWESGWNAGASLQPGGDAATRKEKRTYLQYLRGQVRLKIAHAEDNFKCLTMIHINRRSEDGLNQKEGSLLHSGWTKLGYISQGKNVLHLRKELVLQYNKAKEKITLARLKTCQYFFVPQIKTTIFFIKIVTVKT